MAVHTVFWRTYGGYMRARTWVVSSLALTVLLCLLQATFLFSVVNWSPLSLVKGLVAPAWATALGLILTFSSVSLLPIWAIYSFSVTPGTPQQVCPIAFLQEVSQAALKANQSLLIFRRDSSVCAVQPRIYRQPIRQPCTALCSL